MKEFKETLVRLSLNVNRNRVKHMADILQWFCINCIVQNVYLDKEQIHKINLVLPILIKFEDFATYGEYLSKKASEIVDKAKTSVSTDPIGFKFALALNSMVDIFKQGGYDKTVLLECINVTICVLRAKRSMLEKKMVSNQSLDNQLDLTKRRKTDVIEYEDCVVNDMSESKVNDQSSLETPRNVNN